MVKRFISLCTQRSRTVRLPCPSRTRTIASADLKPRRVFTQRVLARVCLRHDRRSFD